ncbi:MAG TPA: hypothetical protein VF116_16645 [Ktedonobacterales bacterium]
MEEMDGLLAALDLRERDVLRASLRPGSIRAACFIIFAIAFAAALSTGMAALRYGWETGQWGGEYQDMLLDFIVIPAQCLLPWILAVQWPLFFSTPRQLAKGAAALRDSAAQDAAEIPVASDIVGVLDGIAVPSIPAEFGPFQRPNRALRTNDTFVGVMLLACGVLLAGIIVVLFAINPTSSTWSRGPVIGGIVIGLVLCAAGVTLLAEARHLSRRVRVEADEVGLRWEHVFPRRREANVPWGAIRAIFVISHLRGLNPCLACVVDGGDAMLAFDLSSKSLASEVADANRLAKLVLARTELTLLDQTKLTEDLAVRRYTSQYRAAYEALTRPGATGLALSPRLPPPISAPRIVRLIIIGVLPLLLIPAFVLSGIGLQHYQEREYTALLAVARAHTPLYHDTLTAPDADWHAHGPTSGDPNSYTFADGGYLITPVSNASSDSNQQNSPFVEVYAPGMYSDVVVEVTVRMVPEGVPYGSAALALHASEGGAGSNLHFGINGDGSWGITDDAYCPFSATGPYDSTCSYDSLDQASAIHHAAWAPNKLTAILRGGQVICFINDVFVGSAVDPGPQSGRLGFGVEGLGVPGVFSDFTIYPH